jgi:hypothetical protein
VATDFEVMRLVNELSSPIYRLRMAWGLSWSRDKRRKSAVTRKNNAVADIEAIVRQWVKEHPDEG